MSSQTLVRPVSEQKEKEILFKPETNLGYGYTSKKNVSKLRNSRIEFLNLNSCISILNKIRESNDSKEKKELRNQIKRIIVKKPDFSDSDLRILKENYLAWLKQNTYLVFQNLKTGGFELSRASKRGNSVYAFDILKKLKEKTKFTEKPEFENALLRGGRGQEKTNVLFITLTFNTNLTLGNRKNAWLRAPYYYNKFISYLRKMYGKMWVLRGLESSKKGFPHFHLLVVTEKTWDVFRHIQKYSDWKKKKRCLCAHSYCEHYHKEKHSKRIKQKKDFAKQWHSNVDIVVPDSVQNVKDYISKDVLKSLTRHTKSKTDQDLTSLALNWVFKTQSIAISSADLISVSLIQTNENKKNEKEASGDVKFIGLVVLSFSGNKPPPNEIKKQLSQNQKIELAENLFRCPNPNIKNEL